MGPLLRWVLLPFGVVSLALAWGYHALFHRVQENCEPDCITAGDVAAWRALFVIALLVWLAVLASHLVSRSREEG